MTTSTDPSSRACLYLRISKDRDDETSTRTQEAECRAWAEREGLDVVKVYVDRVSGYKDRRRPDYESLMLDARTDEWDVAICWRLDRWTRKGVAEAYESIAHLRSLGKRWVAATQPELNGVGAQQELMLAIMSYVARLESDARSERARSWHAGRDVPSSAPPYGIAAGWTEPVPEEAAHIREAAASMIAGASLRSVSREWQAAGYGGRRWRPSAVKGLILNPALVTYGVLTQECQDEVREGLSARDIHSGRQLGRRGEAVTLLAGLAQCGRCGEKLYGARQNKRQRYRCTQCCMTATAELVEPEVLAWLFQNVSIGQLRHATQGYGAVGAELEQLAERRASLMRLVAQGLATEADAAEGLATIQRQEEQLTEERGTAADLPDLGSGESLEELWQRWSLHERRSVLAACCSVVVEPFAPGSPRNYWDPERVGVAAV